MRVRPPPQRSSAVCQDWRSPLSPEKSSTYLHSLRHLETSYAMFSVSLDEAVGLRRRGRLSEAQQVLSVTPALCGRLTRPLQTLLRAMLWHARHFRSSPNLSPLDPDNFQQPGSRRAASFNDICSRIFLSQRSQFLHKISTLLELVEDLEKACAASSAQVADPDCFFPERDWELLEATHYDLNTCLRESIVVFKCFLQALPDEQLAEFNTAVMRQSEDTSCRLAVPKRHLAHRRMTLLKGQ